MLIQINIKGSPSKENLSPNYMLFISFTVHVSSVLTDTREKISKCTAEVMKFAQKQYKI